MTALAGGAGRVGTRAVRWAMAGVAQERAAGRRELGDAAVGRDDQRLDAIEGALHVRAGGARHVAFTTGLLVHFSWLRSHDSVTRVPPSTGASS